MTGKPRHFNSLLSSRPGDVLITMGSLVLVVVLVVGVLSSAAGFAITTLLLLLVASQASVKHALQISIGAVVLLGLARRLLLSEATFGALGDPLVLLIPAIGLFLLGRLAHKTTLGTFEKSVIALQAGLVVSIVNPFGASPISGIAQFLVVGLPICWFWVAYFWFKDHPKDFNLTLRVVVVLGVFAAAYGRFQVASGFPSWDEAWIRTQGTTSLSLNGFIRPFSFFTAASDYGTFVGLALACSTALLLGRASLSVWASLLLIAVSLFFATELVLQGSRGILLVAVLPVLMALLVRFGMPLSYVVLVGIGGLVLLPRLLQRIPLLGSSANVNDAAVNRQLEGLADPFGTDSTLPGHIARLLDGARVAVSFPPGFGVSNLGPGARSSTADLAGTETSLGDLGLALGVIGVVIWLVFVVSLLRLISRSARIGTGCAQWVLLILGVVPLGPPLVGGNYASQVVFYVLLGGAATLVRAGIAASKLETTDEATDPAARGGVAR